VKSCAILKYTNTTNICNNKFKAGAMVNRFLMEVTRCISKKLIFWAIQKVNP
jgi:hypothetical protein